MLLKGILKDTSRITTKGSKKEKSACGTFNWLMLIPTGRRIQAEKEEIHQKSGVALGQVTLKGSGVSSHGGFQDSARQSPGWLSIWCLARFPFRGDAWTGHLQRSCPASNCMILRTCCRLMHVPEKFKQFPAVNRWNSTHIQVKLKHSLESSKLVPLPFSTNPPNLSEVQSDKH